MALAPQGSLATHFLAVLAAVFPPIAAFGHHAFARRMCTFLSVGHGYPHAQLYTLFYGECVAKLDAGDRAKPDDTMIALDFNARAPGGHTRGKRYPYPTILVRSFVRIVRRSGTTRPVPLERL